jgi:hypothetical protein
MLTSATPWSCRNEPDKREVIFTVFYSRALGVREAKFPLTKCVLYFLELEELLSPVATLPKPHQVDGAASIRDEETVAQINIQGFTRPPFFCILVQYCSEY